MNDPANPRVFLVGAGPGNPGLLTVRGAEVLGRADLVALARPHLANPYFTVQAAAQYGVKAQAFPVQYEPGRSQLYRLAEQAREELEELKLRTRPKAHDPALLRAAE